MKKINPVIIIFILMLFSILQAQPSEVPPAGSPPQKMDMVKELKTKLQLTDEQVKKIETIFTNNKKKNDSLFEKNSRDRETCRKAMDEIRKSTNSEIEKILTKEQKTKFKEMTEKMGNRMPPPPQGCQNTDDRMRMHGNQFGLSERRNGCRCCCEHQRMMLPPPPPQDGVDMLPLEEDDGEINN